METLWQHAPQLARRERRPWLCRAWRGKVTQRAQQHENRPVFYYSASQATCKWHKLCTIQEDGYLDPPRRPAPAWKPGSLAEAHVASAAISRGPVQRCTTQPSGISARLLGFHQARADFIRQSNPNKVVGRGPERAISCPDGCEEGRPDQIRSGRWAVCKAWQGRVNW